MKTRNKTLGILAVGLAVSNIAFALPKEEIINTALPQVWEQVSAQERAKAIKVATRDADRRLLERIRGVRVSADTYIYDFILADDTVEAAMSGMLRGAIHEEPVYEADGRVKVVAKVMMRDVITTLKEHVRKKKILGIPFTVERLDELKIEIHDQVLSVMGNGGIPGTEGYDRLLAHRAAQVDAYRELVGRIMGMRITSKTTVQELVVTSDKLKVALANVLQGAEETHITYDQQNMCTVTMQVKVADVYRVIEYYHKDGKEILEDRIEEDVSVFSEKGIGAPRPEGFETFASVASSDDVKLIITEYLGQRIKY